MEVFYDGWYAGSRDLSKVFFGENALKNLVSEVNKTGRRAFLITSHTINSNTDLVEKVRDKIGSTLVGIYDETRPHSPRRTILEATRIIRELHPDCIISLGGGSATDTAKSVRLALWFGIDNLADFDDAYEFLSDRDKKPDLGNNMLPQISLPTTLVGAEYTAGMGITDEATHSKQVFRYFNLQSRVIILDPELTVDTPQSLWLSTGIKSLEHAIAKLIARERHPLIDSTAATAVKILASNLPRSFDSPDDIDARNKLQIASWLSMFASGATPGMYMGLSHALGRQIGSVCDAPHGLISSVILPLSMDYNAPVSVLGLAMIAQALGVDTSNMSEKEVSHVAAQEIRALIAELGLPQRLRNIGVTRDDLPLIAERTMSDISIGTNPRHVENADEVLHLIQGVW